MVSLALAGSLGYTVCWKRKLMKCFMPCFLIMRTHYYSLNSFKSLSLSDCQADKIVLDWILLLDQNALTFAQKQAENMTYEHAKLVPFFSFFAFINQHFAQILKYFARSCDCTIADFRNSVLILEGVIYGLQCNTVIVYNCIKHTNWLSVKQQ